MAPARPQRPTTATTSASPLSQITNENTSPRSSHGSYDEPPQKTLRRTRSLRYLKRIIASSDSPPDNDSIYNAERVGSREDLAWGEEPETENPLGVSATRPLPLSPASPSDGSTMSHSRWPAPQLNTILEANSISSLRTSRSLPRLKASPGRTSRVVHPQTSINSIHPKQSHKSPKQTLPSPHVDRRRSFSLNDLDCILIPSVRNGRSPQSSSSSEVLEQPPWVPSFPNKPVQPPPYRVPTPPGLPPFGSQRATEYRLRPTNHRSIWNRLWRDSHDSDEQRAPSPRSIGSSSSIPPSLPASPSGEIFKRTLAMIGMSRVVSPPPLSAGPSRAPLPPGIYTSSTPGPLARADDGTYMRGRFGPRTSGHGVGQRNLESHPLGQLNSIDDQIREIDKACERADVRQALSESNASEIGHPGDTSVAPGNVLRGEASPRSRRSSREDRDAYHSGQSPPLFSSPSMPASEIDIPSSAQREFRNINLAQRPRVAQLRSPTDSAMMRHGPGYTPTTIVSLRSLGSHMSDIPEDGRPGVSSEMSSDEQSHEMRTAWDQMSSAFDDCCRVFWRGSWCKRDSTDQ